MTTPAELRALADRVEMAVGPDRTIDDLLANLFDVATQRDYARQDMEAAYLSPAYTTSLDAAVTLVPKGWEWRVGTLCNARPYAELYKPTRGGDEIVTDDGATPALALCAAILRARAVEMEAGDAAR